MAEDKKRIGVGNIKYTAIDQEVKITPDLEFTFDSTEVTFDSTESTFDEEII